MGTGVAPLRGIQTETKAGLPMNETNAPIHDAFDRLQRLLLTMRTGDELGPRDAARLTGLAEGTCRSVLEGLARAGLMSSDGHDRFVRISTL